MNDVLKIFLSMSLSGSLLILIFFAGKPFLKKRVSRQWQYYIWLIVIARLLLPFAPETNLMSALFQTIDHTIVPSDTVQLSKQKQANFVNIFDTSLVDNEQENVKPTKTPPIYQPVGDIITLLIHNVWLVWLTAALIFFIQKITVYKSFVRYVKAGQIPISDTERLDWLAVIGKQAGVKKPVELCLNPLISSPLLIGFFNPCIVLPSTDISEKDFRYIVLHELTHYRRGDMFYKWLVQITVCLHWFNPLVYLMSREINKACEFSCDEVIISKSDSNGIQEYGKTLLDAMAKVGNYKESLASVTLNENKKMLKERLGAIMSFKKKSKLCFVITAALTISLCFGATVSGAAVLSIPNEKTDGSSYINYGISSLQGTKKTLNKTLNNDVITSEQADEMALALTNKIWVWEWVEFFVPYMSEEGILKLIPTAKSAEWADQIDLKTGNSLQFTQAQINLARNKKIDKEFLTKSDIDSHALMIIKLNGRWDCIDFMLPYMTNSGILAVQNINLQKSEELTKILPDSLAIPSSTEIKADEIAENILNNAKSWDCIGILWPYLSEQMKSTCQQKAQIAGTPITSDILAEWNKIPNSGGKILTAADIDMGIKYFIETRGWVQGLEYLIPYMSNDSYSSINNNQKDVDEKGIAIMESCGTWGETIESLLPYMSSEAIEKVLFIYIDRHIFAGISTSKNMEEVEQTIQIAYSYMTQEGIDRVKEYIKSFK